MEASARVFSLGDEAKLNSLFEAADFRDVEITTERHRFVLPSSTVRYTALTPNRFKAGAEG